MEVGIGKSGRSAGWGGRIGPGWGEGEASVRLKELGWPDGDVVPLAVLNWDKLKGSAGENDWIICGRWT